MSIITPDNNQKDESILSTLSDNDEYYRHYKGGFYKIIIESNLRTFIYGGLTEGDRMVTYQALIDGTYHTRFHYDFFDTLIVNDKSVLRFTKCSKEDVEKWRSLKDLK